MLPPEPHLPLPPTVGLDRTALRIHTIPLKRRTHFENYGTISLIQRPLFFIRRKNRRSKDVSKGSHHGEASKMTPTPHQKHVMLYHYYKGKLWTKMRFGFVYTDAREIFGIVK